ncbi:MAG: right-handed parallel beta-helix repeat-containing protein, partial [Thermoplasmata archaeon]|nr:right-handed parallel beta-helix repeat-containing protein [Thermoplasmata archaeon]
YYENLTIWQPLTLRGAGAGATIIDAGGSGMGIYISASDVSISGLSVINGDYGIYADHVDNVELDSVECSSNNVDGLYMDHSTGLLLECIFNYNSNAGVYLKSSSTVQFVDCTLIGNGAYGIYITF